jgi:UDP-N-acetyl-alpha-D-muramoyl-L-alanyl-L-glutamate epimerase
VAQRFIFEKYAFDETSKTLEMTYKVDDTHTFTEKVVFNFEFINYNKEALDRACNLIFFVSGVSYYKAFVPAEIIVRGGYINAELSQLLQTTYQEGLGEFFYVNNLDPYTEISFPINEKKPLEQLNLDTTGMMVGIGGGKDSLLSIELLRKHYDISTWSVGHREPLQKIVNEVGLEHSWVDRLIDPQLIELNKHDGIYNGHIPISAIIASVGAAVCVLTGKQYHVVSNESSASEPTLTYKNKDINHQYSKSLEFEIILKSYLNHMFGESIGYFSLLRPFTELYIAELFVKNAFDKYKRVFSSCNKAFRRGSTEAFWCGECPKCAFVFLALSPFISQDELRHMFGDKDLLSDPALQETYEMLLGITKHKPLECVGTLSENKKAMELIARSRPEISERYVFENEPAYDYRTLSQHAIPNDVWEALSTEIES